jgi:hypothetical protein
VNVVTPNDPVGKRGRALAALLKAPSIAAAAREAQLGEKTLDRYLRDPPFVAALRAAQHRAFEDALGRLQASLGAAVETLRTALVPSTEPPPPTRIRAAIALHRSWGSVAAEPILSGRRWSL